MQAIVLSICDLQKKVLYNCYNKEQSTLKVRDPQGSEQLISCNRLSIKTDRCLTQHLKRIYAFLADGENTQNSFNELFSQLFKEQLLFSSTSVL